MARLLTENRAAITIDRKEQMKRLIASLAAAVCACALAGTASAATAKLNAQVHLTSPDWHLVFQNLVDGNTNGFANERDDLCVGDSGSFSIATPNGSPTKYTINCVHFIDRGATQTDIDFAYFSNGLYWVWRIQDNNVGGIDQVTYWTSTSLVCAAFSVNEGYFDASRRAICSGALSSVTHTVVDKSSANVHLVR